jgi:hypothetical protein
MNEVILEKANNIKGSKNESRNKLNAKTEKNRNPLTEDEFYSIVQELRNKGMNITADFATLKNAAPQERRKEAEKPLYLARYE